MPLGACGMKEVVMNDISVRCLVPQNVSGGQEARVTYVFLSGPDGMWRSCGFPVTYRSNTAASPGGYENA